MSLVGPRVGRGIVGNASETEVGLESSYSNGPGMKLARRESRADSFWELTVPSL